MEIVVVHLGSHVINLFQLKWDLNSVVTRSHCLKIELSLFNGVRLDAIVDDYKQYETREYRSATSLKCLCPLGI